MQARLVEVFLGMWLFASAFLWPHSSAQFANALIVGALCVAIGLAGLAAPRLRRLRTRHLNTALSVWLLLSALVLPRATAGTAWHNAVVAGLVFMFSLVDYQLAPVRRPARQAP